MTPDDLKRLSTSPSLFNLDRLIGPRVIKLVYLAGLGIIVLWSVNHLFQTFGASFGQGLWGVVETAVVALFSFLLLRLVCEAFIVFFHRHSDVYDSQPVAPGSGSIFEDVREALEDLAKDDSPTTTRALARSAVNTDPKADDLDEIAKKAASIPEKKPAAKPARAAAASASAASAKAKPASTPAAKPKTAAKTSAVRRRAAARAAAKK